MSIIKRSIGSISSPLTHIINLSITHWIVPDELKIARVVPIFKSGDKALFSNYRPISVIPCFSKFLERIIYNRIINYLNDFNVLCDNQYGFRKNRSPSLALIDLCDKMSSAFDRREHAIGVFLDLSKSIWHGKSCHPFWQTGALWDPWSGTRMGKKLFLSEETIWRI